MLDWFKNLFSCCTNEPAVAEHAVAEPAIVEQPAVAGSSRNREVELAVAGTSRNTARGTESHAAGTSRNTARGTASHAAGSSQNTARGTESDEAGPSRLTAIDKGKGIAEDDSSEDEGLGVWWARGLDLHSYGEFSMAAVQATEDMEDRSQVEAGPNITAVGVYDGHGGLAASEYLCDHLLPNLIRLAKQRRAITEEVILEAFAAVEEGFLAEVNVKMENQPMMAVVGSCCLVGIIWKGRLFVASLGDSRAVLGYVGPDNMIHAAQLSGHHNAGSESVRQELRRDHPDDPNIVIFKNGSWRVRGIIQVTRSIGDAHLKHQRFAVSPSMEKYYLKEPITRPVVRADPEIVNRVIEPTDRFVIFATDGLWDHLTNEQAVSIVMGNSRRGIAKRLLKEALTLAAGKANGKLSDLAPFQPGLRRKVHDDTSVVVLFIDHAMLSSAYTRKALSLRAFSDSEGPSNFVIEEEEVAIE